MRSIIRINLREPTIDTNLPITDGTVGVEGYEVQLVEGPADAWDQGFGALISLKEAGADFVSIPAFPNRKFRQSYIQVNSNAGIDTPQDLQGKRIGIFKWDNTAGIWARGALSAYYGVDLTAIEWLSAKDREPVVFAGCKVAPLRAQGTDVDGMLDSLLVSGEVDAVIAPNLLPSIVRRDGRARRLFPNYKAVEEIYFRDTGIFPISHVITLSAAFVREHPDAPVALLEAYRRARDVAFERLEGSDPIVLTISWASAAVEEQRRLMGEQYWPYNLVDNRVALDAFVEYARDQGVTSRVLDYMDFFDPEAAKLAGK